MYKVIEFDKDRNILTTITFNLPPLWRDGGADFDKMFNCFRPNDKGYGCQIQRKHKTLGWQVLENRYK